MLVRRQITPDPVETPGAVTIDFGTGGVAIEESDSLSVTGFQGLAFIAPTCRSFRINSAFSLTSLDISNCEDAETITISQCSNLVTVTVPEALNATGFDAVFASFDEATVDAICIALAAGSAVNGVVDLSGFAAAAPSSASAAARAALVARGWTVTTS